MTREQGRIPAPPNAAASRPAWVNVELVAQWCA
jgi:hypothetical protein